MEISKVKAFFLASAKIAVALFFAGLALLLVYQATEAILEWKQEKEDATLGQPRQFKEKNAPALSVSFRLKSSWRRANDIEAFIEGRERMMLYQFTVIGYPEMIDRAREEKDKVSFTVTFLDTDGFKIKSIAVPLRAMTRNVGADGKGTALHYQGKISISADQYRHIADWKVSWQGFHAANLPSE